DGDIAPVRPHMNRVAAHRRRPAPADAPAEQVHQHLRRAIDIRDRDIDVFDESLRHFCFLFYGVSGRHSREDGASSPTSTKVEVKRPFEVERDQPVRSVTRLSATRPPRTNTITSTFRFVAVSSRRYMCDSEPPPAGLTTGALPVTLT